MGGEACNKEECRIQNIKLLEYVTNGLRKFGVKYWLDFGGLLGVIREGDMIVGDDDFDISVTTDDFTKVMEYLQTIEHEYDISRDNTYRKCGDIDGKSLMLYKIRPKSNKNLALLDIFFFEELEGGELKSLWTSDDDTHIDVIFPLELFFVEKWGFSVNIPNDPVRRLIGKYGEDFMTPVTYKRTILGRFLRGKNVMGRCIENRWGNRLYIVIMIVFIIFVLNSSLVKFLKRWPEPQV